MVKAIDISEHNEKIEFKKVKQDKINFIILRIGWIGNKNNHTLDKKFVKYVTECKNNKIPYGVYVYSYCTSIDTAKAGAWWVLNMLSKLSYKPEKTIFIDLEDNSIINCGKENITQQAKEFCKIIENNSPYKAGVYANLNWFQNYVNPWELLKYKIWLAQYANKHTATFRVDLWQYTSIGKVNGIYGNVDINKCYECENSKNVEKGEEIKENGGFEVKLYQNGSTKESVFQDKNCTKEIGYLHAGEQAECYGVVGNTALIVYNIDGSNNKKTGFVKWLGGIK